MLRLYGTLGCHLCERALRLVQDSLQREDGELRLETVDIAGDAGLEDRYGVRIPVVHFPATGAELGWPFDATELHRFCTEQIEVLAARGLSPPS